MLERDHSSFEVTAHPAVRSAAVVTTLDQDRLYFANLNFSKVVNLAVGLGCGGARARSSARPGTTLVRNHFDDFVVAIDDNDFVISECVPIPAP